MASPATVPTEAPVSIEDAFNTLIHKREPLCAELQPYFYPSSGAKGDFPVVKHPLLFSVPHSDSMNAFLNKQIEVRKEQARAHLASGAYESYVWMHERPFRLEAFLEVYRKLSDSKYWKTLAHLWTDSENIYQNFEAWVAMLNAPRPSRESMMEKDDREALAAMPKVIRVYRGCYGYNRHGLSWTIDKNRARWFSRRFAPVRRSKPLVLVGDVPKSKVIAYLSNRGESEIIADPRHVTLLPS